MHRSGISVSDQLKQSFITATNDNTSYLKIQIADEDFKLVSHGAQQADMKADFDAAAHSLEANKPAYLLLKIHDQKKWLLMSYVPDKSVVKEKMLYASSRNALKEQLDSSQFIPDYFLTTASECTLKDYENSLKQGNHVDILTFDERVKLEAQYDSRKTQTAVKVSAIADIPIKVGDDTTKIVASIKSGQIKAASLLLDEQTEVLHAKAEEKAEISDLVHVLPAKEPRFLLLRYEHQVEDADKTAYVFIYYCPDSAPPKQKMFFSACKSMVIKVIEKLGVEVTKNLEISVAAELTEEAVVDVLYPKTAERVAFTKPKKPGKGPARLHSNVAKFSSD